MTSLIFPPHKVVIISGHTVIKTCTAFIVREKHPQKLYNLECVHPLTGALLSVRSNKLNEEYIYFALLDYNVCTVMYIPNMALSISHCHRRKSQLLKTNKITQQIKSFTVLENNSLPLFCQIRDNSSAELGRKIFNSSTPLNFHLSMNRWIIVLVFLSPCLSLTPWNVLRAHELDNCLPCLQCRLHSIQRTLCVDKSCFSTVTTRTEQILVSSVHSTDSFRECRTHRTKTACMA